MSYTEIDKPTENFNAVKYSGTGSAGLNVNVGFATDFTLTNCELFANEPVTWINLLPSLSVSKLCT